MKLIEDFSVGLFFWQSLIFIALIFLLRKYAWKPILSAVNEREEKINNALEAAKNAEEAVANLKADNDRLLQVARLERDRILKAAREGQEAILLEAKETASKRVAGIVERARQTIENEKMAAIIDLKNQIAEVSINVAEKLVKEKLSSHSEHTALAEKLVEEINLN